jgi:hypothetical protein
MPFPSEEARREAYYTHAKLFLKAKERMIKEMHRKAGNSKDYSGKKGRLATVCSFY